MVIEIVRRIGRHPQPEGYLPKHLVARENSKKLVNAEYMRLPRPPDSGERTVGGPDFVVLNESIIYERLNNLLYRLGNCAASGESDIIPRIVSQVFGTYTLHLWAQLLELFELEGEAMRSVFRRHQLLNDSYLEEVPLWRAWTDGFLAFR